MTDYRSMVEQNQFHEDARRVGHFLAVANNPYEGAEILGVYDSFEAARNGIEERITADKLREFYKKPREEWMIDSAEIEEWSSDQLLQRWERRGLNWVQTVPMF